MKKLTKKDKIRIERINLETKLEDLWDWICSNIGFDERGREIQNGIREFVKLKVREIISKKPNNGKEN